MAADTRGNARPEAEGTESGREGASADAPDVPSDGLRFEAPEVERPGDEDGTSALPPEAPIAPGSRLSTPRAFPACSVFAFSAAITDRARESDSIGAGLRNAST